MLPLRIFAMLRLSSPNDTGMAKIIMEWPGYRVAVSLSHPAAAGFLPYSSAATGAS